MGTFRKGETVEWKWGGSKASGKVAQRFTADVTRKIKGKEIKRKADEENPAYLVTQDDGDRVLKKQSELSRKS